MGNNTSDYFNRLQSTVFNDKWMKGVYGEKKAQQQEKLKEVFSLISENNVDKTQKAAFEKTAQALQDKVEKLEAKMAALSEELSKNEAEISKHADKITDLVTSVESKSNEMETKQKEVVKNSIDDVFYLYQRGDIGKDAISSEIRRRVESDNRLNKYESQIEGILGQLKSKQNQVQSLIDGATKWMDQKNLLQSQYGATKSAYNLINRNMSQIGAMGTTFTNLDSDTKAPVFSLEKTDIVSDFFASSDINVKSTNTNFKEGDESSKPSMTLDDINEKYQDKLKAQATSGVDSNASGNIVVQNLKESMDMGLLEDLESANLTKSQITDFFTQNFGGANIVYNSAGKLSIPYGHDNESRETFDKLTNFIDGKKSGFQGALNTWDKDSGNTIDSNKQIESLSKNYESILDKMGNNEPKFTFKEAMYALFDSKSGLFKNSGVIYNLEDQSYGPNYSIQNAGDEKTADMYTKLTAKIKDIWGVDIQQAPDLDREGNPIEQQEVRTDPITFSLGKNSEYAFVIDRDKDGTFTSSEEFVGGSKDSSWLDDLKSLDENKDGKLNGDELKNLKVFGSQYTDNAQTINENGFMRGQTTQIDYTLSNAQAMNIDEIDLNGLEDSVNQTTGKTDINGSELFNDSFTFKLNGQDVTASRKDDTQSFMNSVYGAAYGKGFTIGLNDKDAQSEIDAGYREYDDFSQRYSKLFGDINILKNASLAAQQSESLYKNAMNRAENDKNAQLIRASNKAASLTNDSGWQNMQSKVALLAAQEGITVDMEQIKGIYVLDNSLDASSILHKYQDLIANEKAIENDRTISKEAFGTVLGCAREGLNVSGDEILSMLKDGSAKNSDEALGILREKYGISNEQINSDSQNIEPLSQREDEIFESFNNTFNEAGLSNKLVDALFDLIQNQMDDSSYMEGKSADELSQELLKKYQEQ